MISGALLGAGFTEGTVYILDAMSLESAISEPFRYSRSSVTHISFSHDSQYMATAVSTVTECGPVDPQPPLKPKEGGVGTCRGVGWGVGEQGLQGMGFFGRRVMKCSKTVMMDAQLCE